MLVFPLLIGAQALAQQQQPQPGQPSGQSAAALLKKAESSYEQLEYERALQTLVKVHQSPEVTQVQRARAYLYMGVCFTALGNPQNAVAAFAEVLKRRPDFRMPDGVSPSIRAMFDEALKQFKAAGGGKQPAGPQPTQPGSGKEIELDARAPRKVVAGEPVKVRIDVDDPKKRVKQLVIHWRRRRGPDYSRIRVDLKPDQTKISAVIPGATIGDKAGRLAFYVEARDAKGQPLTSAGTEEDPYEVILRRATKPKSRVGWWLLAAGGAAAVAGGVVAAVLLTRDDGPSQPVPPDTARLTVILR